jgi:uncharacterized membrane protein YqgA involved in biofilm formation
MRFRRFRFTIGELLGVVAGCGVLFSVRPHIYWGYLIIFGSIAGFALHRKISGRGILGAIVGAGIAGVGISIGAYLGLIDPGGPMQHGMRTYPEIEFAIVFGLAICSGAVMGLVFHLAMLLESKASRTKAPDPEV